MSQMVFGRLYWGTQVQDRIVNAVVAEFGKHGIAMLTDEAAMSSFVVKTMLDDEPVNSAVTPFMLAIDRSDDTSHELLGVPGTVSLELAQTRLQQVGRALREALAHPELSHIELRFSWNVEWTFVTLQLDVDSVASEVASRMLEMGEVPALKLLVRRAEEMSEGDYRGQSTI